MTLRLCGFAFLLLALSFQVEAAEDLTGGWVGIITGGVTAPLRIHLDLKGKLISGTLSIPSERLFDAEISKVQYDSGRLQVQTKTEAGIVDLSGVVKDSKFTGTLTSGNTKSNFDAIHVLDVDIQKYFGVYEVAPDHFIYIRTWDELGEDQLTFFDDRGQVGPLFATSNTDFFSGPGIWIPLPAKITARFVFDEQKQVTALSWEQQGSSAVTAKKVNAFSEEEIAFSSSNIKLGGSLVIPNTPGPHPAVVLVHGSGPVTRDFYGPMAYLLVKHGIAVLSYDKRGIGKSAGNWLESDFQDLASDALAAVQFLKTRKEINAQKIGMLGISQGGWIVPLAASQSTDVHFAILISAPAVSPQDQDLMTIEQEMRLQKVPEEKMKEAVVKERSDLNWLRSDEAKQKYQADVAKLTKEGNTALLKQNGAENPRFLLFLARILLFDPIPVLQKVKCPVLAIYGDLDRSVPLEGNKVKLESALKSGGNTNVTVRVLPKGDHALLLAKTGSRDEFPFLNEFVPGFFDLLTSWINSR